MSVDVRPFRKRLSSGRSLVIDLLHYDQQVPNFAHERICHLAPLADVRQAAARKISWPVLFLKAYAAVAAEFPALRQCYLKWPWPHLYQHPFSVGTLVISRRFEEEDRLFWVRFTRPEQQPLATLQETLEHRCRQDLLSRNFRRQILISRLPTPLRRTLWWTTLNLSGQTRARRLGTFGLTTLAGQDTVIQCPPSPLTSSLTFGPLDESGRCRVIIGYDHRVLDGATVASALARLEALLCGPLCQELLELKPDAQGAAAAGQAA